jgi:hypothetical protein
LKIKCTRRQAKPKVLGFDAPEDEIAKKCEELLKEIAKL